MTSLIKLEADIRALLPENYGEGLPKTNKLTTVEAIVTLVQRIQKSNTISDRTKGNKIDHIAMDLKENGVLETIIVSIDTLIRNYALKTSEKISTILEVTEEDQKALNELISLKTKIKNLLPSNYGEGLTEDDSFQSLEAIIEFAKDLKESSIGRLAKETRIFDLDNILNRRGVLQKGAKLIEKHIENYVFGISQDIDKEEPKSLKKIVRKPIPIKPKIFRAKEKKGDNKKRQERDKKKKNKKKRRRRRRR